MKSTIEMFRNEGYSYLFLRENEIIFGDGKDLEGNENGRIIFNVKDKTVKSNIIYSSEQKRLNYLIEHFKKELGWIEWKYHKNKE